MLGPVDFSIDNAPKVHFSNLAKEFSKLGFEVQCVVYASKKYTINTIADKLKVVFAPNPLTGNLFLRTLKYTLFIPVLLWNFFKFGPFLVYFRFSPPAFLYLLFLKLIKIFLNFKIILEFNSWVSEERAIQGEGKLKVRLIDFLQLKSVALVDHVRVVTPGIKDKLNSFEVDCGKVAVIGNGTDVNHFKPINKKEAKEKIGLEPDFLYVGFIGNFAVWQGLNYLLQAIPEVLKSHNDVKFLLVGDGPEMAKIRKAVLELEKEKIILTGKVPYQETNLYINAFDIGVAPFIRERNESIGLSPLKIRDYAACGVPIITTRIRGLKMVEEKNIGVLVPPNDSSALSNAIIKLIENPDLRIRMGRRGREVAKKEFSWENVARKILYKIEKASRA